MDEYHVHQWVENLKIPWELVFLSKDRVLVTERDGRIQLIKHGFLGGETLSGHLFDGTHR